MRTVSLLTLDAAAALLAVSPRTMRRLVADGSISAVRIGRLVRVHPGDLEELINRHREGQSCQRLVDRPLHGRQLRNAITIALEQG